MALVVKSTGNTIAATDVNQYHDLFTGVMTDQPIGFTYLPGTSTSTPVLLVKGNANGPLLQAYNGATQKFQVDQNGNIVALGITTQLGDKMGGVDAGLNISSGTVVLGGTGVFLKQNTYWDGSNDRFTANGSAYQFNITTGPAYAGPAWRYASGGTAGAVITWSSWLNIAIFRSAGGGTPGAGVWVGTSDPSTSAAEGDVWIVG
jgi:hypothetical protein